MKKSVITKLSVGVLIVAMVCGCRMIGGPSDEKLINTTMADWKTALKARNLDKVMVVYSENYVSQRGSGKDAMREFMTRVFSEGWMDNVKVDLEEAKPTIEEDKAQFGPVEFTSDRGTMKIDYALQKENGAWLIVSSKMQEQ